MRLLAATAGALITVGIPALARDDDARVVSSTDYRTVDCNATSTRQTMMTEYNAQLPTRSEPRAIDVHDQTRKAASRTSISCYGSYDLSDGSTKKILYREMINSLGKTVWTFTPDSW